MCREQLPVWQQLIEERRAEGLSFTFLSVAVDVDPERARTYRACGADLSHGRRPGWDTRAHL